MSTDGDWDDLLDAQAEVRSLDEGFAYRKAAQIHKIANGAVWTLPDDLQKPFLLAMDLMQRAQERLING